jgi:hypothetical protein
METAATDGLVRRMRVDKLKFGGIRRRALSASRKFDTEMTRKLNYAISEFVNCEKMILRIC